MESGRENKPSAAKEKVIPSSNTFKNLRPELMSTESIHMKHDFKYRDLMYDKFLRNHCSL